MDGGSEKSPVLGKVSSFKAADPRSQLHTLVNGHSVRPAARCRTPKLTAPARPRFRAASRNSRPMAGTA